MEGTAVCVVKIRTAQIVYDYLGCILQGPEAAAAARQKEVFQALARFCSQVSGEAISEDQVKHFRFRDWRRFTQVRPPLTTCILLLSHTLAIRQRTFVDVQFFIAW